jgi:hypothetical protein
VRQTETAAIKKAEGSRGTFDRKLTAVYTSATLEASMPDLEGCHLPWRCHAWLRALCAATCHVFVPSFPKLPRMHVVLALHGQHSAMGARHGVLMPSAGGKRLGCGTAW